MPDILKSLWGKKFGFGPAGRPLVNPTDDPNGAFPMPYVPALAIAASSALSNSTAETTFSTATYTIPANSLQIGSLIQMRYQVIATATNSSDTLAVKLKIGGTTLISHTATDVTNNDTVTGEYEVVLRTIGAAGTMVGVGVYKSVPAAEGTMTSKDDILASTTIDTTTNNDIVVTGQWSVASTNNSARCDFFRVKVA